MKALRKALDATIGTWSRHLTFVIARSFFVLRFNISCTGKHLLQDLPGGLILATHVSRFDGPLITTMLYSSRRVRPAVHYDEYYKPLQYIPMLLTNTVPVSSPKDWPAEQRAERKSWALETLGRIMDNGSFVLLFPAGYTKRTSRETIEPYFSGAFDLLQTKPDTPVIIARIQGLGRFDAPIRDRFWWWTYIKKGRRHVSLTFEVLENPLDTSVGLEAFNQDLEDRLNDVPPWPQMDQRQEG